MPLTCSLYSTKQRTAAGIHG